MCLSRLIFTKMLMVFSCSESIPLPMSWSPTEKKCIPEDFSCNCGRVCRLHCTRQLWRVLWEWLQYSSTPSPTLTTASRFRGIVCCWRGLRISFFSFAYYTKCSFRQTSLTFLGHVISSSRFSPDPEKVRAFRYWPPPKKTVRYSRFLRLCKFLP